MLAPRVAAVVAVFAALAGAFAMGRFSAGEPETHEVERVVYRDRTLTRTVVQREEARTRVVYRDRVVTPDGTVTEREVEREDTRVSERAAAESTTERASERARSVTVSPEVPRWRLSLLAGASLRLEPLGATPAFGVSVDYRIVGPFTVGVWATSSGAGGLSLGLVF